MLGAGNNKRDLRGRKVCTRKGGFKSGPVFSGEECEKIGKTVIGKGGGLQRGGLGGNEPFSFVNNEQGRELRG